MLVERTWMNDMATDRSDSEVVIIDASLTLRLVLDNPAQETVRGYFEQWFDQGLLFKAPTLWVYEVTSAILKSVHFEQLTAEEGEEALQQALGLDIDVVVPNEALAKAASIWTSKLSRASAYDSFYLALADEYDAPLWTADGKLVRAVALDWVRLGTK